MTHHFCFYPLSVSQLRLIFIVLIFCTSCKHHTQVGSNRAYKIPAVTFETSQVHILTGNDKLALHVELAIKQHQLAYGLMERPHLPKEQGMLFLFQETQPADAGFWMFRTRIPLDIAYINDAGKIVSIQAMDPCKSPSPKDCTTYIPGEKYSAALEVNKGYFVSNKIQVGDQVLIPARGV